MWPRGRSCQNTPAVDWTRSGVGPSSEAGSGPCSQEAPGWERSTNSYLHDKRCVIISAPPLVATKDANQYPRQAPPHSFSRRRSMWTFSPSVCCSESTDIHICTYHHWLLEEQNPFPCIRPGFTQTNVGRHATHVMTYKHRDIEHHPEKYPEPQSEMNRGVR